MLTAYIVLLKLGNKPETWSEKFPNWLSFLAREKKASFNSHSQDWAQTHFLLTCCGFTLHCLDGWNVGLAPSLNSLDLALACSVSQMIDIISQFYLSFWLLDILCLSELLFVAGLEPYVVHCQPRPDPVFSEHGTGVGPLYLSMVAGPFLLPSPLLPWPWTHSNVLPLLRQDGETQTLASLQFIVQSFSHDSNQTQKLHFCQFFSTTSTEIYRQMWM